MINILYFTADWCHPCKKVKPIVEELNRESADVKFQVIDADSEVELVKSFEIKSVPTFVVIKDGVEIKRASGAQTKQQLESLMTDE
jgi:thioredoxin-like negative regulator of GroEL